MVGRMASDETGVSSDTDDLLFGSGLVDSMGLCTSTLRDGSRLNATFAVHTLCMKASWKRHDASC